MFNGYGIYTHRIYSVKYSQQILMSVFEMSHFDHVLFLTAIIKLSIQGNNLTDPIYILFSTELRTSSISTFEIYDKKT